MFWPLWSQLAWYHSRNSQRGWREAEEASAEGCCQTRKAKGTSTTLGEAQVCSIYSFEYIVSHSWICSYCIGREWKSKEKICSFLYFVFTLSHAKCRDFNCLYTANLIFVSSRFQPAPMQVLLSEEITGSLRQIKVYFTSCLWKCNRIIKLYPFLSCLHSKN